MKSNEIVNLMLSPQWTGKLIHHFLSGAMRINQHGIKTELIYLTLPLLADENTRSMIKTNIKSTFYSTFVKNNSLKDEDLLNFKNALLLVNNRVEEYKNFTNRALIFIGNICKIKIGDYISIDPTIKYQNEPLTIREYCKSAYYLGVIFAKEDYLNIFLKLGITKI